MTAGDKREGIDPKGPFQVNATGLGTLWIGRDTALLQSKRGGGREGKGS